MCGVVCQMVRGNSGTSDGRERMSVSSIRTICPFYLDPRGLLSQRRAESNLKKRMVRVLRDLPHTRFFAHACLKQTSPAQMPF